MKTWFDIWPVYLYPLVPILFFGIVPTVELKGSFYGSGPMIESMFNHIVIPIVPAANNADLVNWWMNTNMMGEKLMYLLIAMNIYVFLLIPIISILLKGYLITWNWYHKAEYESKRKTAKRS